MKKIKNTNFRISKLVPSIITLAGICFGLSAIRYAIAGKFEVAVSFVVIATFLDVLDGKFARALKAVSEFGSQLDSLSDFINFGFVPVFLLYLWSMHEVPRFGWAAVLFFTMCCAIRLARFNVDIDREDKKEWEVRFFKGLPSPAGALACLSPIMFNYAAKDKLVSLTNYAEFLKEPYFLIIYSAVVAILMASRVPTYSIKKLIIKREFISLLLVFFAILIVLGFIQHWLMVLFVGAIYFALIPVSTLHYYSLKNKK